MSTPLKGRIIRGIGGFYYVLPDSGGDIVECKARGSFRSKHLIPMVGDMVGYSFQKEGYAVIEEILPRKNELVRPAVSNIDLLIIVVSASRPKPDYLLLDKLLLKSGILGIEAVPVLNKCDEAEPDSISSFLDDYGLHFKTVLVSAKTGEGLEQLKSVMQGKITCFAGQSAVGKSSLINALVPGLDLETGNLSRKTDRGKHTTRKAELWPVFEGAVLDTPGFSLYETELLSQNQLDAGYPEFLDLVKNCYYTGCTHTHEPNCAVKDMVKNKGMTSARYERYCTIVKEIEQERNKQYD